MTRLETLVTDVENPVGPVPFDEPRITSAARLLLIGDLLDTVAGTTKPSKRIADHYWQLRDGVQEILQDPERCRVTDTRHKRHKRRHRSGASRSAPKGDT